MAETVLLRWRREYAERGEAAFTPTEASAGQTSAEQRMAELERFCGQLALENAARKKALQHLQAHQAAACKNGALSCTCCCRSIPVSRCASSVTG